MSLNIKQGATVDRPRRTAACFALSFCALACSETSPAGPEDPEFTTVTVDAAESWAFVDFADDAAVPVTVAEPRTSAAWDLGFFATSVMLNGGAAGPAGVLGYCVCQNAGVTDAQVIGMDADAEAAEFGAVTAAQIPADDDSWMSDSLAAAISGWWSYDPVAHVVSAAPENVWKVRTASGEAYAKLHVTLVEDAARDHAGRVTIEYALQPSSGAPFEAARTAVVDVSDGPVPFDLETGNTVSDGDGWDLVFEGYDIRVNGGVSGDGAAGAVAAGEPFDAITDASDVPAQVYAGDAFGGVFEAHPWYRYNLEGNHQIWPTYDVYLIRDGDAVYKVQLIGYYGPTGDTRQITLRYARLR